ncbi:MAG: hypothetical protein ABI878_15815 [Acidobacteriota bacterium]
MQANFHKLFYWVVTSCQAAFAYHDKQVDPQSIGRESVSTQFWSER